MKLIEIRKRGRIVARFNGMQKVADLIGIPREKCYRILRGQTLHDGYSIVYIEDSSVKEYRKEHYWQTEAEIEFSLSPSYNFEDLSESEKEIFLSL